MPEISIIKFFLIFVEVFDDKYAPHLQNTNTHMNVKAIEDHDDPVRPRIICEVINEQFHRPFLGFNRAQFSVIELAVLSTRLGRIDDNKIRDEMKYLKFGIDKTEQGELQIPAILLKEFKVVRLINGYRTRGHLFTRTNPVRERRTYKPNLELENFELSTVDLKEVFDAGEILGLGPSSLENILIHLHFLESLRSAQLYKFLLFF